jgi:hypothetical protein
VTATEKIRPWASGEKFSGISIVDSLGGIRQRPTGIQQIRQDLEPDPESSSWPVAGAVSNTPPRYPSGILGRANPLTGELGRYEADDAEIIYRLFGVTGPERNL